MHAETANEWTPRGRRIAVILVVSVVAALALAFWLWQVGAQRRAVKGLPADERAQVFRLEYASFKSLCGAGVRDDALEERCQQSAAFLLEFSECDAACRELCRVHTEPRPIK